MSQALTDLMADIIEKIDDFKHIDLKYVGVCVAQARKNTKYGIFAKTYPLRFEDGKLTTVRNGRVYGIQRIIIGDVELKYAFFYYFPRFLELTTEQKVTTVIHEMYHVSPEFNGDLRRFPGHNYAHTSSRKNFDAMIENYVKYYMSMGIDEKRFPFLTRDFLTLEKEFGAIMGKRIRIPKLIPLD